MVATVRQHGADGSGGFQLGDRQKKDAERRDKMSVRAGKDPRAGKPRCNFQNVGDAKNGTAGL